MRRRERWRETSESISCRASFERSCPHLQQPPSQRKKAENSRPPVALRGPPATSECPDPRAASLLLRVCAEDPHHPAERFGGSPEELIADAEGRHVLRSEPHLAKTSDGNLERAGHGARRELGERRLRRVLDEPYPGVALLDEARDVLDGQRAPELDGEPLRVTAHRADADALSVD